MKSIVFMAVTAFLLVAGCVGKSNKRGEEDFAEKINKLVLNEKRVGQEFFFKVPVSKGILEYKITYLGIIKTSKGENLKFLHNVVLAGLYEDSKRASCTVNIYNNDNEKIGHYYVGGVMGAPAKVDGGNLVFSYNNDSCDQTTVINFADSIPHQIFVSCTKEGGDLYTFTSE